MQHFEFVMMRLYNCVLKLNRNRAIDLLMNSLCCKVQQTRIQEAFRIIYQQNLEGKKVYNIEMTPQKTKIVFQISKAYAVNHHYFKTEVVNPNEKKKLKIFPQNYSETKEKIKISSSSNDEKQKQSEIKQLKAEISMLHQEFREISSNMSKNTSRDFNRSIYQNELERTRRISELNEFNQNLYNLLALKLKQIAVQQSQNYNQQIDQNMKFLDSVQPSAEKIKTFFNFHQDNYLQKCQSLLQFESFTENYQKNNPNTQEKHHSRQSTPQRTFKREKQSPFLIQQEIFEVEKLGEIGRGQVKSKSSKQTFTFHKQKQRQSKHFRGNINQVLNSKKLENSVRNLVTKNIKELKLNNKKQNFFNKQTYLTPVNSQKSKVYKQIEELNKQLEKKIMQKRSVSQYDYSNKLRKY